VKNVGLLLLAALAPSAFGQAEAPRDRIWKVAGGSIAATVESEGLKEVAYRVRKGQELQRLRSDEVRSIEYADRPPELDQAAAHLQGREYENAVLVLRLLATRKDARAWVPVHARFRLAEALHAWGRTQKPRLAEAITAYQDLLAQHPDSRFRPHALEGIARCLLRQGNLPEAERRAADLERLAFTDWGSPVWVARARLLGGEVSEAARRADEALTKYAALERFAREKQLLEVAAEAHARQGTCLLSKGDVDGSEKHFRRMVEGLGAGASGPAAGMAWLGLGRVLMARRSPREARLAFVQALALGFGDDERTAEAALGAGQASEALAREEKDAKGRAQVYYRMVLERFPSARVAPEARALLDKMK
jgi:tetratricopeptide (TPR) repeat protein